jgi:hypothetical protein
VVGEVGKVGKRGERGGGERGGRIVWGLGCNVGYFQSKKYAFIYLCLSPWVWGGWDEGLLGGTGREMEAGSESGRGSREGNASERVCEGVC